MEDNDQTRARREHLDGIRNIVGNVYPNKFERSRESGQRRHRHGHRPKLKSTKQLQVPARRRRAPDARAVGKGQRGAEQIRCAR